MMQQRGTMALVLVLLPVLVAMRPIDMDMFVATFVGDRAKVEALVQDGGTSPFAGALKAGWDKEHLYSW